ncbi:TetR/AcrR family transcriptional regulator [Dongia mobilis]|uniref:TetR/AcrR family transcriptional regulator n=1 Tax=Dongia sp. TaxID=1977262 RepID=UPI0026EC84DB
MAKKTTTKTATAGLTPPAGARVKLLDAAMRVIRERGYGASSVDEICAAAGVTKGAFFHHFPSKEDLAVAAAAHFGAMADGIFATAPYRACPKAADRVLGYVAFRKAILRGELADFTCLLGTMVQETYDTHPAIRAACDRHMSEHAAMVATDIAAAMRENDIKADWTPESLAYHTQSVIQGAFIFAKAKHGTKIAEDCLDHLTAYLTTIFKSK